MINWKQFDCHQLQRRWGWVPDWALSMKTGWSTFDKRKPQANRVWHSNEPCISPDCLSPYNDLRKWQGIPGNSSFPVESVDCIMIIGMQSLPYRYAFLMSPPSTMRFSLPAKANSIRIASWLVTGAYVLSGPKSKYGLCLSPQMQHLALCRNSIWSRSRALRRKTHVNGTGFMAGVGVTYSHVLRSRSTRYPRSMASRHDV